MCVESQAHSHGKTASPPIRRGLGAFSSQQPACPACTTGPCSIRSQRTWGLCGTPERASPLQGAWHAAGPQPHSRPEAEPTQQMWTQTRKTQPSTSRYELSQGLPALSQGAEGEALPQTRAQAVLGGPRAGRSGDKSKGRSSCRPRRHSILEHPLAALGCQPGNPEQEHSHHDLAAETGGQENDTAMARRSLSRQD